MPSIEKFQKTPTARKKFVFDYSDALDTGVTISTLSYAVEAVLPQGCVTTPTLVTADGGTVEESGQAAYFFVGAGQDGFTYKVSLIATASDTQVFEDTISVQVKNP